ncbi:methyl-accepting chemotaxis protein [Herbaspirillum sp. Sphag1AN]|uniref:methyl-accepting chemotaxis protein n=1 Tax=unclassified Herbaspirillum TaxID=2624150 RepID=UPI001616DC2F|nr:MULTISPECIES: methyl-accepting chemotaxis protein [unclassified Herbaspirillum]MBB3211607.1 methyl-accepting chemotaxis protein [Herbaspirillum sp. Sphag1AN]MBB3245126.1 methyl-accepting chemotaxis protein [Herbaspirillum sp. Sphag64]
MKLSFNQRLWAPLVVSLIALLAIATFDTFQLRSQRLEERKAALVSLAQVAMSVIKDYAGQAQNGTLSKEQAQTQALARLKMLRYGKDGYFSVSNSNQITLMHAIKPELNGKDLSNMKDPVGNLVFVNISKAAAQPEGGFVEYFWSKVGHDEPVPKTSFALRYEPWDWIITTGIYMDDVNAAFYKSLSETGVVLLVVIIILSLFAVYINRSILRSIGGDPGVAAEVANRISDGDLTLHIDVRADDSASLLYAFKRMRDSLTDTIGNIKTAAETIATASSEIASGNLDLSSRTEQQAGSIEETASAMEELTSTVKQNADNARQANQLAVSASEVAVAGGNVVSEVVTTMGSINDSSRKIVDIISVIDGIAFQTNILALNAAVEAARAGEQGRGFAVVASEVRSLAQRSSAAAKEIKLLIDDSVSKVDAGSTLVKQAGDTMNEVVSSVKRVTDIVGEISSASQEQSAGINEVGQAIGLMDQSTQQNAALVEQAAAAAKSLQDQAATLATLVGRFTLEAHAVQHKVVVKASNAPVARPSPTTSSALKTVTKAPTTRLQAAPKKAVGHETGKPAGGTATSASASSEADWETF